VTGQISILTPVALPHRRSPLRWVLALILAFIALPLVPALAVAKTPIPGQHGVQIVGIRPDTPPSTFEADLNQAKALHANVVRTDLDWAALEPTRGAYDPKYQATADSFFAAAKARGIRVLLTVLNTPCWNTTAPAPASACKTPAQLSEASRYQPRDLAAYARMVSFVAARYQTQLSALEVWNEPDQRNELYWAGPDKVARYAELLRTAYPAIKAAAPTVPVLAGALVGTNGAFLEALYKAGIKGSYDGLSLHFYDLALYALGQTRAVRAKYGDKTPIWLGEFGFTSCTTRGLKTQLGGHACVTKAAQARNVVDVLRALGKQKDVKAALLFQLRDDPTWDFGTLDRDGKRKPLFTAVANAYQGKLGKEHNITLRMRSVRGTVTAIGSAPAGDAYIIEVRKGGQLRYRAAFRVDRRGQYAFKLPKVLGRSGLKIKVRPYTVKARSAFSHFG
jgi:hypothetical protein